MEVIAIVAVVALVYFYISNNSRKVKDETVIETTQTVKTEYGQQTIRRKTTINDVQTEIRNAQSKILYPEHKIIQPNILPKNHESTPREFELMNQLKLAKQRTKELEVDQFEKLPKPQLSDGVKTVIPQNLKLKECPNCKRTQPISEFRANHNQPDGLTKWCISCLDGQEKLINPATLKGMKYCPKCRQNRRKSSFYPTKKYPDGLSKWCKFCLK